MFKQVYRCTLLALFCYLVGVNILFLMYWESLIAAYQSAIMLKCSTLFLQSCSPLWNCPLSTRWPLWRHSAVYTSQWHKDAFVEELRQEPSSYTGFSVLSFLACLFQPNFYKGTTLNLEWVAPPPPFSTWKCKWPPKLVLKDAGHRRPFKWWTFWFLEIQKSFW